MCPACDGLGVRHDFDPDLLVPDPSLSVWEGAIEPIGPVKEIGRWRRHMFEGVAANLEADPDGPPKGTMLKGPWSDSTRSCRHAWLYGTGRPRHRPPLAEPGRRSGRTPRNGTGVATELLAKFTSANGGPLRRQARTVHAEHALSRLPGCAAQPARRAVRVGGKTLVELGALPIGQVARFFDALAGHAGRRRQPPRRPFRSTRSRSTIAEECSRRFAAGSAS